MGKIEREGEKESEKEREGERESELGRSQGEEGKQRGAFKPIVVVVEDYSDGP